MSVYKTTGIEWEVEGEGGKRKNHPPCLIIYHGELYGMVGRVYFGCLDLPPWRQQWSSSVGVLGGKTVKMGLKAGSYPGSKTSGFELF